MSTELSAEGHAVADKVLNKVRTIAIAFGIANAGALYGIYEYVKSTTSKELIQEIRDDAVFQASVTEQILIATRNLGDARQDLGKIQGEINSARRELAALTTALASLDKNSEILETAAETVEAIAANPTVVDLQTTVERLDASLASRFGAIPECGDTTRVVFGSTPQNGTVWDEHDDAQTIRIDIDTTSAGFDQLATYHASLYGAGSHWEVTGAGSIYSPTTEGFRVHLRPHTVRGDAAAWKVFSEERKWHIRWIGIGC